MNCTITSATFSSIDEEGVQTYTKVKVADNVYGGKYSIKDIKSNDVVYGYTTNKSTGAHIFAVFKIVSVAKQGFGWKILIKRSNAIEENDNNILDASFGAFACDCVDFIEDIPSGSGAKLKSANLTEMARTYNLLHLPKAFVDVIKVDDIVTDMSAEDRTKRHYFNLQHTPLEEELVYMEINGVNYYEQADDMIIDRENKRIYFDTQDDDFSFKDLQDSVSTIRVFYHFIKET